MVCQWKIINMGETCHNHIALRNTPLPTRILQDRNIVSPILNKYNSSSNFDHPFSTLTTHILMVVTHLPLVFNSNILMHNAMFSNGDLCHHDASIHQSTTPSNLHDHILTIHTIHTGYFDPFSTSTPYF